ncbi:unnamed protein product, partial [Staurois parvus]
MVIVALENMYIYQEHVSTPSLNPSAVVGEYVYVENATVIKPNWEKYMGNTVKWMTFLVHTTKENCVLVMGTVKTAVANALMAGKVTDVNAPHQRNTVWTQMDFYAVEGGLAYVENANALMTGALGLCVNTALNVAIPVQNNWY